MTDYRLVMLLLMQHWSYRQIEARAGCSHATIAKAKQICEDHGFETVADIEQLTAEDLELFSWMAARPPRSSLWVLMPPGW